MTLPQTPSPGAPHEHHDPDHDADAWASAFSPSSTQPLLAPAVSSSAPYPEAAASPSISRLLYASHFLSTWNSRLFEFGAILFVASLFPGTLLPTSAYALARSAAAILLSPAVGRYIDAGNRLQVVRVSIVMQRFAVAASCVGFGALLMDASMSSDVRFAILAVLATLACVEKLGSVMNLVAVERDWVVVVAENTTIDLKTLIPSASFLDLNSQMRRIDLFCKLVGPLAIALVDGFSTQVAILVTLTLSMISVGVEYLAIAKVYMEVPALQVDANSSDHEATDATLAETPTARRPLGILASWIRSTSEELLFYFHHPVFIPSISLSLLYFTVLSFSGQMVTYLLTVGYDSAHIGLIRTVSVLFEMSATWIAPRVMAKIGPIRGAIWFISWQTLCVSAGLCFFWGAPIPLVAAAGLVGGVIASRIGLWGFDMCVQLIIQEGVEPDHRGAFSSLEASFQNFFEFCSYASTMVFARPEQFRYPVLMSSVAVAVAGALYAGFVRKRRGHLLHVASCINVKERRTRLPS